MLKVRSKKREPHSLRTENTCVDLTRRPVLTPCVVETELQLICLETGGGDEVMKIRVSGSRPLT